MSFFCDSTLYCGIPSFLLQWLFYNLKKKIQEESLIVPAPVDQLLSDYAKRFNEIKTPRKLLWKKNLGTVKVRGFKDYKALFHVPVISMTAC